MRKALYILGHLSDLDIEWIIAQGRAEDVAHGHTLIQQGRPIEYLYLILAGWFAVVDERMDGQELARLGHGEIVGEMSFIDANPPSATVVALEPGRVLALSRSRLQAHLDRDPAFAARFYRALAIFLSDRLRATVSRLGYGEPEATSLDEDTVQPDELDPNVLGTLHLAGTRFDRILKKLSEA